MLPIPIFVSGAKNVTWTGETGCTPLECQIIQPSCYGTVNHSTHCSYIVFEDCQSVSVSDLGFIRSELSAQYPRPCHNVKLVGVEDAALDSVMLEGKYGLGVFNASGRYKFVNSFIVRNVYYNELNFCPNHSKNCSFSLNMTNVTFISSQGAFFTVGENATEYSSISILVDNCSFTGFGHNALVFTVWNYPSDSFAITVRSTVLQDNIYSVQLQMMLRAKNWSLVEGPRYRPLFLLDDVSISNSYYGIHINLSYEFPDNNSCDVQNPEIIIANSSFFNAETSLTGTFIHGVHASLQPTNSAYYERCHASYPSTILKFRDSKFYSNQYAVVVCFEGFSWHRAAFEGGNEVSNNCGIGLSLNDTQLEIHGYNVINENDGGGLYMTSDSLLLMANGSVLNLSHNSAEFGGGIHISYKGRGIASYEDFLHCYVYKTTCPGWCFFQFVDQNGHLLRQNELNAFDTNLSLDSNHASKGGHEIFNGHLHNCSIMTEDGVIGASTDTLLKVLPSQVLEDDHGALDSLPQYICLCNTSKSQDSKLWNCQGNFSLTIYPGADFLYSVVVLNNLQQSLFQSLVTVRKDGKFEGQFVTSNKSIKVQTVQFTEPSEHHTLQLRITSPGPDTDYVLNRSVVFTELSCPLGMNKNSSSCTCNSVLADHGFECSGHWYKSVRHSHWIGMDNGRLVFVENCLYYLCDSSVLANGIPSDSVNLSSSSQCSSEYGREGLICTQCPENQQPEYFSMKCRECPYEWIALLLVLFIRGLLVVVVLFLFNLTAMQGTVNGFILYCNMMINTSSTAFFAHNAWQPPLALFRYLSLRIGHGLCFFNEFSKALLQFAFPFYLLTLVATIIICAHKCNFRIFQITFIARRAVPVLTTLMIMTFAILSDAVLQALRYNRIHYADTGEQQVVFWLDGTLPYLRGKHLAVGLLAIICSIVYLLPLIGVTLFGDLLRRCIRSMWLSHFTDVFHGAYRYPFGFWLGVRLLARVVLIVLALSVDQPCGRALGLFVVILCVCLFQLYFKPFRTLEDHLATSQYSPSSCRLFSGHSRLEGILIKLQPSTLDLTYLLNALITTAAIIYSTVEGANVTVLKIAANVSLIVALLQFLVILCYHTYRFLPLPKSVRMCLKSCSNRFTKGRRRKRQQTVCDITPTFDDTAAHAEPIMTIRLHPPQDGDHDNNYDSDESSSMTDNSDDIIAAVHVATEVADISPGLTEPLLQSEYTTPL